jgi:hypothetical protein
MESKSILILPASIDTMRAHYVIPGSYKYLTKKIRLSDFEIINESTKPLYFGAKGIYSLIKSVQLINMNGVVIDTISNTDFHIIKMMQQANPVQRDIYRLLYQNMCNSVDVIGSSQIQLTEQSCKQDVTKIGSYIDISFMSDYLMQRNISDDFMTISIEWVSPSQIAGGYKFTRPPSLYVDEVLTSQPVDSSDVILYDIVVPDKLVLYSENLVDGDGAYDIKQLKTSNIEVRLNSYNQQIVGNMYFYMPNVNANGSISNGGLSRELTFESKVNIISDGVQLMPFGGLDSDAKRLAHLGDMNGGDLTMPGVGSYYMLTNQPDVYNAASSVGLFNVNTDLKYVSTHNYSCVGVNKMVTGELVIQFSTKAITLTKETPIFVNILSEVKRYYDRRSQVCGNLTVSGGMM